MGGHLGSPKIDANTSRRAVEIIRRNARSQARMVDDLLDTSRIITGKLTLRVQPVDLSALILAAATGLRPAAQAKEIALELQLDEGAGQVAGDPTVCNRSRGTSSRTPSSSRPMAGACASNWHTSKAMSK